MKVGDIITVVALSGEYVGEVSSLDKLVINKPRMILQSQDGKMGFAKGVAVTGEENPETMMFDSYVFATMTNENIANAWKEATGKIVVQSPKVKVVS
jgi:hypothetical protein